MKSNKKSKGRGTTDTQHIRTVSLPGSAGLLEFCSKASQQHAVLLISPRWPARASSPPLHNLLSKTFLSFPAPLFIIWPRCDGWNIDHRGQLRKSLHLSSQRLLGGQACHFPEKHFIYQILIRLECPSPWEVDELWLLFKKKKIHSDRVLGKLRDLACHMRGRRLTSLDPESLQASPAHSAIRTTITAFQPQNTSSSQSETLPTKHLPVLPPSCPWQPLPHFLADAFDHSRCLI